MAAGAFTRPRLLLCFCPVRIYWTVAAVPSVVNRPFFNDCQVSTVEDNGCAIKPPIAEPDKFTVSIAWAFVFYPTFALEIRFINWVDVWVATHLQSKFHHLYERAAIRLVKRDGDRPYDAISAVGLCGFVSSGLAATVSLIK